MEVLQSADTERFAKSLIDELQFTKLERDKNLDFSF